MTQPTVDQPRRRWRRPQTATWLVLVAMTNLVSTGIFVFAATHASSEAGKSARAENCASVIDAFDAYTNALAKVSGADEERVQEFRDAYEPELKDCH